MAKVAIKKQSATSFGGIFYVIDTAFSFKTGAKSQEKCLFVREKRHMGT